MEEINPIQIENAASMSELERLEALFMKITNTAIQQLEDDLTVARALGDDHTKRHSHVQIGMYRHAQSIFHFAKRFATHQRWNHETPTT